MEKHCDSIKRFGKEESTSARNEILESFIRHSGGKAHEFAYKLSGNNEEAKELVQEALYRVARAWDKYEQCKPLDNWFFVILRNVYFDLRKKAKRWRMVSLSSRVGDEREESLEDFLADCQAGPLESIERAETVGDVRQALKGLSPKKQAVLGLCDMDGMEYAEISRSLRVPVGTVRSRIFRARQAFRDESPELAAVA